MPGAYSADLAYIHDQGYGDFARNAAPGLLRILHANGIATGRVIDLGCGSGIWAAQLCRRGYDVTGVDLSPAMLAIARRRAPKAKFVRGSLHAVPLPPCDAVTALGECFNYLFDAGARRPDRLGLLKRIYAALRPGGVLIFDMATPGRGGGTPIRVREGRDWMLVSQVSEDAASRTLTRRIVAFRRSGRSYRRIDETHRLRLFPRTEMADWLRTAGFRVRTIRGYGDVPFPTSLVGFIARRPERRPAVPQGGRSG